MDNARRDKLYGKPKVNGRVDTNELADKVGSVFLFPPMHADDAIAGERLPLCVLILISKDRTILRM
jgi:hypothetical protein